MSMDSDIHGYPKYIVRIVDIDILGWIQMFVVQYSAHVHVHDNVAYSF